MKKFVALLLTVALVLTTVCAMAAEPVAKEDLKVGVILLHDENIGYDAAHITGVKAMQEALGLSDDQIIWEYGIPENEECADAAERMAQKGCR